jgi:glycosyltransferase involved in cell wall biosynthesis
MLGLRILYLSAEPMRKGQASGTHIAEVIAGLSQAGHKITPCIRDYDAPYHAASLLRVGIAYLQLWARGIAALRTQDAVYARGHFANLPVVLAARLLRVPTVHEVNGPYMDAVLTHRLLRPFRRLIVAMQRIQYRSAAALLPVTEGLGQMLRRELPDVPMRVVPNGVNAALFRPASAPAAAGRKYAIFFGGFTRWHGVDVMTAAVAHPEWPHDLDLLLIGDGQMVGVVREAQTHTPRLRWQPTLPQDVLAEKVMQAQMGLVPINSVGERGATGLYPLKLFEILACGVPAIVTDYPGQADLVRALGAGLVIPPGEPAALARAVAHLHAHPIDRQTMLQVACRVAAEHSWPVRVREIDAVLRSLAGPRA